MASEHLMSVTASRSKIWRISDRCVVLSRREKEFLFHVVVAADWLRKQLNIPLMELHRELPDCSIFTMPETYAVYYLP